MVKTITKLVTAGIFIVLLFTLVFNSFYTVNEQQKAIVTTFGKPTEVVGSGPHFKIPFVQKVQKVKTTVEKLAIGYEEDGNKGIPSATMITGDFNFVNADFYLEYEVVDPIKAIYNAEKPVNTLLNITQSAAREIIGTTSVDEILTTGKAAAQSKIEELIVARVDTYDLGIKVNRFTIQDVEPPTPEVVSAFKSVEEAKQNKETEVNNATAFKNEKLPEARASADKLIQDAQAKKDERISEATGAVARFNQTFEEYAKNKDITKKRLFYEAMESVLPEINVIITNEDGSINKLLPLGQLMK